MKYTIKISGKQYNDNYTYDTQNDGDFFGEIKEIIEEIEKGNIDTLELSKNQCRNRPRGGLAQAGNLATDETSRINESEVLNMEKYIMVVTDEQIERSRASRKAIESLEYNPMCYNCKNFKKSCKGSTNKTYTGCIYKEVDKSKKSIYAQILEQVKQSKRWNVPPSAGTAPPAPMRQGTQ